MSDDLEESNKRRSSKTGAIFPYTNLEDAVGVARAMYEAGAVPLSRDQLAARMHTTPDSGTFALKISAAQTFGLVKRVEGKIHLTEVGTNILSSDDAEAQGAKVSAFLNVDLYKKLVDHFKGKTLPPKDGVEAAMVSFGVAPKQKDRARQAFERSAAYAGYLNSAKDRLVAPILAASAVTMRVLAAPQLGENINDPDETISRRSPSRIGDPAEEKLIRGMLDRLPPLGEAWPISDRARWLRRFAHNLAMVYAPDDDAEIEVKVLGGN